MLKRIAQLTLLTSTCLLVACGTLFDKDNTPPPAPLTAFTADFNPSMRWSVSVGEGSDSHDSLKLQPVLYQQSIYTTSANGRLTAVNTGSGAIQWQVDTGHPQSAGPGAGDGTVVVGSRQGHVTAYSALDGHKRWQNQVEGEILANPVIEYGLVYIKTSDGNVRAMDLATGVVRWYYQQTEPSLILRGASTPRLYNHAAFVGFANGNLVKLGALGGQMYWSQQIATAEGAFSIQRMIDIDADPLIFDQHVYVATFQGKVARLDWQSGREHWSHDLSSYSGMSADASSLYVSDAKGHVWAFAANSGLVSWRQLQLENRSITGPADAGQTIVVGDGEGYLHWLNKRDGHVAARVHVGSSLRANPLTQGSSVFALTDSGNLMSYTSR